MDMIFCEKLLHSKNATVAFRLMLPPTSTSVSVAASNLFRIMLDGELLGYGPRRSSHNRSLVNSYELAGAKNPRFLVVEVASYQINSFYTVDEPPFFACEVYQNDKVVFSAHDFEAYHLVDRISKVPRYSFQRAFAESYVLGNDRENLYYGRSVNYPQLGTVKVKGNTLSKTDLSYPELKRTPIASVLENGYLVKNSNPYYKVDRSLTNISEKLKGYAIDELECHLQDEAAALGYKKRPEAFDGTISDGYALFDLGKNNSSFLGLDFTALDDCEIYLMFDEILYTEALSDKNLKQYFSGDTLPLDFSRMECCNVVKYKAGAGTHKTLSFEVYTLRYLKVAVKGKIKIDSLYHIPYKNSEVRVRFSCDDTKLNAIFDAATETFAQNAVDILTDCPSRERAGWLCDSYFSARAEKLITGRNAVEKNFLDAYLHAPISEFLPPQMPAMCYPADHNDGVYIPNWAMFLVVELKDYLLRTNDRSLIDAFRDRIISLVEFFESKYVNGDGLLEKLDGWVFVEWSKTSHYLQDVNFPTNMLYHSMLLSAAELYGIDSYAVRAAQIKDSIIRLSYNGEFFEDNAVRENNQLVRKGNTTETCQYYAFYFGIADEKSFPALFNTLISKFGFSRPSTVYENVHRSNAFIGNFLRLDLLKIFGKTKQMLDECVDYLWSMADRTGTLWENDDISASCNHGFTAYTANLITAAVCGYQGFDKKSKTIFLSPVADNRDFTASFPIGDEQFEIARKHGNTEYTLPNGYKIRLYY